MRGGTEATSQDRACPARACSCKYGCHGCGREERFAALHLQGERQHRRCLLPQPEGLLRHPDWRQARGQARHGAVRGRGAEDCGELPLPVHRRAWRRQAHAEGASLQEYHLCARASRSPPPPEPAPTPALLERPRMTAIARARACSIA
eukprot:1415775-Prymnesium_polylepis.1